MWQLEKRLGFSLGDPQVALTALTHKSYVNEHRKEGLEDNERLEFLGDAVVDLAISHRLMERFPEAREGVLSKIRATIVNEEGLFLVAKSLGLGDLLRLGRGEELTGGREKPSVLADALEAVVAAIYLDGGLSRALQFVDRFFAEALDAASAGNPDRDYKTQVQELAQSRLRATPRYQLVDETGPDHAKIFQVEVLVGDTVYGRGEGRSKKEAEQWAASAALDAIQKVLSETDATGD